MEQVPNLAIVAGGGRGSGRGEGGRRREGEQKLEHNKENIKAIKHNSIRLVSTPFGVARFSWSQSVSQPDREGAAAQAQGLGAD